MICKYHAALLQQTQLFAHLGIGHVISFPVVQDQSVNMLERPISMKLAKRVFRCPNVNTNSILQPSELDEALCHLGPALVELHCIQADGTFWGVRV